MGDLDMVVAAPPLPDFAGEVLTPGHPDYETGRRVWNVMHDRRPAVIARCRSTADVAAAIAFARAEGMPLAVRGGGHSLPGLSSCDDGLVLDLSLMREIVVDPAARTARVQGGALLGDLDAAAQAHGLVVPAGVISHTGVAGLTLGGGVGRLMRRLGLTVDSLLAVELVTADGRVVTADASTNTDLFWGVRGGGGNFGVVTAFTFALHPLTELAVLSCWHALDDLPAVLALAEQTMSTAPDELLWTSFVRRAPDRPWQDPALVGSHGLMSVIEWSGDIAEGVAVLTALREQLRPLTGSIDVIPFAAIQRAGDEEFGPGLRSYVKATFADALTPELAAVLVERAGSLGSPLSQVELLSMGGAIARVAPDATAFPHRDARWLVNVPASWTSAADDATEMGWVRDTFAALGPHTSGGAYANFMDVDEPAADETAYGVTLRRLAEVKADWDPDNVFRLNQNVLPAPR